LYQYVILSGELERKSSLVNVEVSFRAATLELVLFVLFVVFFEASFFE